MMLGIDQAAKAEIPFADNVRITTGFQPSLILDQSGGFSPVQQWTVGGDDSYFSIDDATHNRQPFAIKASASDNCLVVGILGRVGFGTNNPVKNLHVVGNDPGGGIPPSAPVMRLEALPRDGYPKQIWDVVGANANFILQDYTNSQQPFSVEAGTPTDTLYLANLGAGHVGIGTANPDANSKLDIRSSLLNGLLMKRPDASAHYLRVETTAGVFRSGVQGNGDAQFGALSVGKGLNLIAGGTTKVLVNSAGQMSFGNTPPAITSHALIHQSGATLTLGGTWTNASSRVLKQDIEPITSEEARDTVRALQPVGYRYKNELDERYVGFIAEDVPDLVATNDRKGLASMDITAVLTKVVQDQDRELSVERETNALQQKLIAELSERLLKLEQTLGDRDTTKAAK
jgi:hypothetical protein